MNRALRFTLLGVSLAASAGVASAHPDHGTASFASGLVHPLQGLDHLLAMVAVGLWSATALPVARRAAAPVLFLVMMLAGALLGHAAGLVPFVEPAVAASVVLLGVLLVAAGRLDVRVGWFVIATAALAHGYAHGTESVGAAFAAFAAGFAVTTALLHAAGVGLGVVLERGRSGIARLAGVLVSASGLVMLATRV